MLGAEGRSAAQRRPGQQKQMSRRSSQEHHGPPEQMRGWGAEAAAAEFADTGAGVEGRELLFARF